MRRTRPWSRIERREGVCGGSACIVKTRIAVWHLERLRRLGAADAEILKNYPQLDQTDLSQAWEYVDEFKDEIATDIIENEQP